jgi:RNA polymerase sigma factor (sigma-70 family)
MTTAQAETITRCIRTITATHLAALSDSQLLERYAGRRDEAAFTAMVRRHGPLVLGVCRRVLRDVHAAEDAFQATFLVLARRAGGVGRPEALAAWLHGVAVRVALKARVREARRRRVESRVAAKAPIEVSAEDPAWQDLRPLLDEAVGELPDKLRVPFVLHYLQGQTVSAVARQLGCPRGTVATHLARARQRLRARLLRRGLTLSTAVLGGLLSRDLTAGTLSPILSGNLLKTAASFAAEQATAGAVPAGIVALAQGGFQAMSLSKRIVLAAALLLTLGTVGGTVLLAQGTARKEQTGTRSAASPMQVMEKTDLSLFREGSKLFRAEEYTDAHRSFTRLVELFPHSPLAPQARELASIAREMRSTDEEASVPLARARMGRRIIDAVLAGARAAELGQERTRPGRERVSGPVRDKQKANELMQRFNSLYKEGRYEEAEMAAAAALKLDPNNTTASAAWELARAQRRRGEREPLPDHQPGERFGAGLGTKIDVSLSGSYDTVATNPRTETVKAKDLEQRLQRPVNLNFRDAPLSQVLDDLRTAHGLNIVIDRPALEREGVALDRPVTLCIEGVSLRSALKLLLETMQLTYDARDGAVVVTTPSASAGKRVCVTYPVGKLLGRDTRGEEALIRLITRTIRPRTWAEMGGPGTIEYFPMTTSLVVAQSPDVHKEIRALLADLLRLAQARDGK